MPNETSTQTYLTELGVESPQEGTKALPGTLESPVVIAGTSSVQQNSCNTGKVGTPGNKFS
jgi:hypothetical protein